MADEAFDLTWDGDVVLAVLKGATIEGLELAAEHLLQVSSSQAPHEEGDLERSGEVSKDETQQAVAVSYDRPYAVRQHEDMTLRHDEGRKAKYLEDPMNEERDTMLAILAKAAGKPLGG